MAYQDDVPSGPIVGGMVIDSDGDDDPKQSAGGPTSKGEQTQVPATQPVTPTPKPGLGTQQKEVAEGATAGASEVKKVPAPKPARGIEKRKTQSHGSVEELELPTPKRSQGKSKSPPSVTGTVEHRLETPKGTKQEMPPSSNDQVPLRNVFDWLIMVFSHLDSLERVWEVCTQEKALTPPANKPTTQRSKKLRCLIPLDP